MISDAFIHLCYSTEWQILVTESSINEVINIFIQKASSTFRSFKESSCNFPDGSSIFIRTVSYTYSHQYFFPYFLQGLLMGDVYGIDFNRWLDFFWMWVSVWRCRCLSLSLYGTLCSHENMILHHLWQHGWTYGEIIEKVTHRRMSTVKSCS